MQQMAISLGYIYTYISSLLINLIMIHEIRFLQHACLADIVFSFRNNWFICRDSKDLVHDLDLLLGSGIFRLIALDPVQYFVNYCHGY